MRYDGQAYVHRVAKQANNGSRLCTLNRDVSLMMIRREVLPLSRRLGCASSFSPWLSLRRGSWLTVLLTVGCQCPHEHWHPASL